MHIEFFPSMKSQECEHVSVYFIFCTTRFLTTKENSVNLMQKEIALCILNLSIFLIDMFQS